MTAKDAAALFQQHREELGFVNTAQCEAKDLYVVREGDDVVGAALGNHCVRKPQTTLYELAVDESHRRKGVATELIDKMARDSPHDKLVAKCPVDLPANNFYESTGWVRVDTEAGKNRELHVWQLPL